ncbi:MAG: response regulator [Deltaproteobacteria bacterium]|nr:response regulator [Deltaproteobacteria bacterium]
MQVPDRPEPSPDASSALLGVAGVRNERLRAITLPRVHMVAVAMTCSVALALVYAITVQRSVSIAAFSGVTVVVSSTVWWLVRRDRIAPARANLVIYLMWMCVSVAVLGSIAVTDDPGYDAVMAVLFAGYGAVQLDRKLVIAAFVPMGALWIAVSVWHIADEFSLIVLLASVALGVLSHVTLRRFVSDVEQLQIEADARSAQLAVALAAAEREIEDRKRAEADREIAEAEREQLHAQFVAAQRMEAVGTLAGGVAHDLNNVLAVILAVAEYVQGEVSEELANEVAQITEACQRGAELTRNLVGYARGGRYRNERVALDDVAKHVSRLLQRTIPKRIALRTELERATVMGDAAQLGQVVLNLCLNSVDAIPDHGEIVVAVNEVDLDAIEAAKVKLAPGRYVCVQVSDDGTGMEPAVVARVFEPFFTTKGVGQGSGLGLAMVYGTVRAHHGAVAVHSEPGEGTTMSIYLPATAPAAVASAPGIALPASAPGIAVPVSTPAIAVPAAPRAPAAPPEERASRASRPIIKPVVLIIDDEPGVRASTKRLLESEGYDVLTAESGDLGVSLYEQRPNGIAVVLLDMAMPGMTGRECFTKLRAIDPTARILIASGYSTSGEAQACLRDGALGYLSKPVARTALAAAIATASRGQRVGAMVEFT